jgi:hypothetical protein
MTICVRCSCKKLLEDGGDDLVQSFRRRVDNVRSKARKANGLVGTQVAGRGRTGTRCGLADVLEKFIQDNKHLKSKECLAKALQDVGCKKLLEDGGDELAQRFKKRVGNVRSKEKANELVGAQVADEPA